MGEKIPRTGQKKQSVDRHQWHSPDSQAAADYVEGTLENRRLFEEHLDECTRCRLDVEALQRMQGRKRTWAEEEPYHRPRAYRPLFSGLALALPILLILAGLTLPRNQRPKTPGPAEFHWTTGNLPQTFSLEKQKVVLGPHSQLERKSEKRLHLTEGRARINGRDKTIELATEQIEVFPLGSDFEVFHTHGLSRVHLYSGKLKVRQRRTGQVDILDAQQPDWPHIPKGAP